MLEKIIAKLSEKYDMTSNRGVFFSLFDENKQLLLSKGVFTTNKTLEETLMVLYNGLVNNQKNIAWIGVDIILSSELIQEPKILATLDLQKYGLAIHATQSEKIGILLPGTSQVSSIGQALQAIKTKNEITGDAEVYIFTTERELFKVEAKRQ